MTWNTDSKNHKTMMSVYEQVASRSCGHLQDVDTAVVNSFLLQTCWRFKKEKCNARCFLKFRFFLSLFLNAVHRNQIEFFLQLCCIMPSLLFETLTAMAILVSKAIFRVKLFNIPICVVLGLDLPCPSMLCNFLLVDSISLFLLFPGTEYS